MQESDFVKRAMSYRSTEIFPNCAETLMLTFADEMGISQELACSLGSNFGGGMKTGNVCGVVTASLMIMGAIGINTPSVAADFQKRIKESHDGMITCTELLSANKKAGGDKKSHCDAMIREAIGLIEEYLLDTFKEVGPRIYIKNGDELNNIDDIK